MRPETRDFLVGAAAGLAGVTVYTAFDSGDADRWVQLLWVGPIVAAVIGAASIVRGRARRRQRQREEERRRAAGRPEPEHESFADLWRRSPARAIGMVMLGLVVLVGLGWIKTR